MNRQNQQRSYQIIDMRKIALISLCFITGCVTHQSVADKSQDSSAQGSEVRVVASPNQSSSVNYEWILDDPTCEEYTHRATLHRGSDIPWSFTTKGRAIEFSWSPNSRYLLFGVTLAGRDMALYALDTQPPHPKEHDLNLAAIEKQVESALPLLPSGSYAGRSRIDFERIEWVSDSACQLHYHYCFDRKNGDAILSLNLAAKTPILTVINITPSS